MLGVCAHTSVHATVQLRLSSFAVQIKSQSHFHQRMVAQS